MIRKEEVPPHIVILDTNILWHKEKTVAVNPEFDLFWDEFSSKSNLELLIPEVVRGELLFQQSSSALKLMNKATDCLSEVSSITDYKYSHKITSNRVKAQVETRFNKWLKTKKATIEPVPTKRINWGNIVQSAIWREPPFEFDAKNPKNEKGFRDAVILETVIEYCEHDEGEKLIAFICNDFLLRTTAEDRMKHDERFSVFESLDDFESYLRLQHEQLTDKFIKSLLKKASEKFFKKNDDNCLVIKEDVNSLIEDKYKKYMDDPKLSEEQLGLFGSVPTSTSWTPYSVGKYWVANTQFQKIEDTNVYHWATEVTFVRKYYNDNKGLNVLTAPEADKISILSFIISWSSKISKDGRFRDSKILAVDMQGNKFELLTDDVSERWQLNDG